jgi:crotonobetainyl-CoA:carnitine CoA-transferase CaiB-like acyl-CoA transferase
MAGAGLACHELAAHNGRDLDLDGPALLERGRALDRGVGRRQASFGGTARIIAGADGPVVANLCRADDWELVPAWLDRAMTGPATWAAVADSVRNRRGAALAARAGELGLAVAPCPAPGAVPDDEQFRSRHPGGSPAPWVATGAATREPRRFDALRVVDLSALWAGPLLGSVLAALGAHVTKVEDPRRRDATRPTASALARRLNRAKRVVEASFAGEGHDRLAPLLTTADVVIESTRPRALDQLGFGPRHGLPPGQIWVSVTAYGRTGPWSGRVGFGDDTAAAGGLYRGPEDDPGFIGDAVADPLTGLHGAVAVMAAVVGGWSGHIDLALRDTAATVVGALVGGSPAPAGAGPR